MKKSVIGKIAGLAVTAAMLCCVAGCKHPSNVSGGSDPNLSDPISGSIDSGDSDEDTGVALKPAAGWWVNMMENDVKVAANSSAVIKFKVDDVTGTTNWSTPDVYLIALDDDGGFLGDVGVARTDHYGFVGESNTIDNSDVLGWTLESNWNWSTFLNDIKGAVYTVTVKNYGDKADVLMNIKCSDGSEHFMYCKGMAVAHPDNLYVRVTGEPDAWTGTLYGVETASLAE